MNPYLESLGLNTANPQAPAQSDLHSALSNGLFGWWWYPLMDHIERKARQLDQGSVGPRTQQAREQWDELMRARNAQPQPTPYVQPNMTGGRG